MTNLQKEEILNQIRKEHGIALDSKDPIFAVITANEIILKTYIKELEEQLIVQKEEIESITEKYLNRAKELAEKKISHATQKAQEKIIQTSNEVGIGQPSNRTDSTKSSPALLLFCTVTGAILGYGLALLLL